MVAFADTVVKHVGRITAFAGLLVSLWLVSRDNPGAVFTLMRNAGGGLVLAGVAHVLPMLASARAWQTLIRSANRPSLLAMLRVVWIRQSINGMLPVARIGGEIASFRFMRRAGLRPAAAVANLVVDLQLLMISQLVFTMIGIGFLLMHAEPDALKVVARLAWGVAALAPLLVLFALVQHVSPFKRITGLINRATSGKLSALAGKSARIDQSITLIWRRRGIIFRYVFFWQSIQCCATAFEIWLALHFLGVNVSFLEAVVIESLIQAINSAAFFVPGGLGVQEGGFVLICGALGIDPATSLALAGARRIRDLVVYLPGLLVWQFAEAAGKPPGGSAETSLTIHTARGQEIDQASGR